jgi:hypothetical protein
MVENQVDDHTMLWLWQSTGAWKRTCLPDPAVCPLNAILGEKGEKRKKKHRRPADVASLQCHPLPRCWHASIVVATRLHRGGHARIHSNSLAAMPHLCPLVHARGLHSSHHTTASFIHFIQNVTVNSTSSSKPSASHGLRD